MSEDKQPTEPVNEGEGSRTAARAYNKRTEEFVETADVKGAAERASEALDGPEGDSLRKAEAEAKAKKAGGVKADREL